MWIGLLASNAALAEYFVTVLGLAGHAVTLYPSREDLFFALFTDVSLRRRVPYDLLLIELLLDGDGKQMIAELCRLARDQELPLIVLTTSGQEAIALAQAAFPWLCIRQLPLRLSALLPLIQAQGPSTLSAALPSDQ
jgi:DNA-binding response OmpR family regulator